MSNGDVRRSHWQASSKSPKELRKIINQRPKGLHEEDNTVPAILVDVASTATLKEENLEVNNDLLLTENQKKKKRNKTYLAIKHNCLKDKQRRFVPTKNF